MLDTLSQLRMEPVPFVIAMVPSWGRSPNIMACTKSTGGNAHQCLHTQQVAVLPLWTPTDGSGISHPNTHMPRDHYGDGHRQSSLVVSCDSCTYAKMTCSPLPKEWTRKHTNKFGSEVHTDKWGPSPVKSLGSKLYYISFTNDKTRYTKLALVRVTL